MVFSHIKRVVNKWHFSFAGACVYALVGLPLLYLPNYQARAMGGRLLLLILLSTAALSSYPLLKQSVKQLASLPLFARILLFCFCGLIGITVVDQAVHGNIYWLGIAPLYLGLLAWLSFLVITAICVGRVQRYILSRASLCIGTAVLVLSLYFDFYNLHRGLRLAGLMYQPTTLALYTCILGCLALYKIHNDHSRIWRIAAVTALIIASVCIMATQSRIGILVFTCNLLVWAVYSWNKQQLVSFSLVALTFLLVGLPFMYPAYFSRLHSQSLRHGTSYRFDLYSISTKELVNKNILLGNGPATFPNAINQPQDVPPDIALTLGIGDKFASTHNLFLDVAYFYGDLAAVVLLALTVYAPIYYYRRTTKPNLAYALIYFALLANALFNVSSLELTSLFFVVMFGLFANSKV